MKKLISFTVVAALGLSPAFAGNTIAPKSQTQQSSAGHGNATSFKITRQISVPATTTAAHAKCQVITPSEVAALFDRWNGSLATLNAHKVAQNYTQDAVLLATVSNTPRLTDAARVDYFEHFLAHAPVGHIISRDILIDCNQAVDVGLYDFKFDDGRVVNARYTFVYRFDGRDWKIAHHHSSAMPEAVVTQTDQGAQILPTEENTHY